MSITTFWSILHSRVAQMAGECNSKICCCVNVVHIQGALRGERKTVNSNSYLVFFIQGKLSYNMFTSNSINLLQVKNMFLQMGSKYLAKCLQAKIGREKEFEAALQRLRGKNVNISDEAANIKVTQ